MKKVEVNGVGFKVYDDNGTLIGYEADVCGEGTVYKDYDAYKSGEGICYVSEHGFDECEGWFIPLELAKTEGTDKEGIKESVRWAFSNYELTDEIVDYIADDVFELAEWAYIDTYLAENEDIDEILANGVPNTER